MRPTSAGGAYSSCCRLFLISVLSCCLFEVRYAFLITSSAGGTAGAFRSRRRRMASLAVTTTTSEAETSSETTKAKTTVAFSKYHGLGNDFILIDNRDSAEPSLTPDQSRELCDRNFGVGGDGVIFALRPSDPNYDFAMRIYNSDGSEPEMCGNGIRCMAQFLQDLETDGESAKSKSSYRIHTLAGPIVPVMNPDAENTITVDMGEPILKGSDVPTTLSPNDPSGEGRVIEQTYHDQNGKPWKISAVSMGNPHAIIFVDDLEKDIEFEKDGPTLECAPIFPSKTNVEFVQVMSDNHLIMKVWERGAGPTLACGTGACALAVAAMLAGKIPRSVTSVVNGAATIQPNSVRVTLPGGDLFIEWNENDNKVYMTGPATFAFQGTAQI